MRREAEHFGERELELIYIAKRLKDALRLEEVLTQSGVDYLVKTDKYRGGVIFVSERMGAFFYVETGAVEPARAVMEAAGFVVWDVG